jgi:hypothetical protein
MACAMVDQLAPSNVEPSEKSGTAIEKGFRLSLITCFLRTHAASERK